MRDRNPPVSTPSSPPNRHPDGVIIDVLFETTSNLKNILSPLREGTSCLQEDMIHIFRERPYRFTHTKIENAFLIIPIKTGISN
jgi:hypothetical protein